MLYAEDLFSSSLHQVLMVSSPLPCKNGSIIALFPLLHLLMNPVYIAFSPLSAQLAFHFKEQALQAFLQMAFYVN